MPIFFSLGYLIAVIAVCSVFVYAIVKDVQLFVESDNSPLTIAALSTVGVASLFGLALFLKLIHRGILPYFGVAVYAVSTVTWLIVATISPHREIASLEMLLATFGGMLVFLFTIRRAEGKGVVIPASTILALSLLAQPLLPFVGLIVCCGLVAYGIMRSGERRGSLSELLVMVALIATAIGVSTGVRRAMHPLYTDRAVILPLDKWSGPLAVSLPHFDVWVEYPKAALSAQQKSWFEGEHEEEHFYQRLGADLRPTVVVKGKPEKPLKTQLVSVSDTHDWVGESLDRVRAPNGQSTIYLDRDAAAELGHLGARLVIDVPHRRRTKRNW